jgi:HAD superfamily hydrolase (TIGR01549 family)
MSFATYGRACEVPEHLVDEFVKISLRLFAEKESPPAIFDGMSEVIQHFSSRHKLAIVTTNSSQNVNLFLAQHGLSNLFHAVYGVDTPGSKAHKISLAMERFVKNGEAVFMIGDALSDVRAAKEAGVTSIAVTWGHQSLETLQRGEPDYVVNNPREFGAVIGNW